MNNEHQKKLNLRILIAKYREILNDSVSHNQDESDTLNEPSTLEKSIEMDKLINEYMKLEAVNVMN